MTQVTLTGREGDRKIIDRTPGGQLWEDWRLGMESEFISINHRNEDRALLEQALREN